VGECGGGPCLLAAEALLGASGAGGAELAGCWVGAEEAAGLEDLA
jgi:hypothetical protein